MPQQMTGITRKISPTRLGIAVALVIAGIALVIFNFTPSEAGIITISLPLLALEGVLIIGGAYAFTQGFRTKFCVNCNKALSFESKLYELKDEQKLRDYLTAHDKKALASASVIDSHLSENAAGLTMEYCKNCHSVGVADLSSFDDRGKETVLLKDYPMDRKHFDEGTTGT